MLKELVKKSEIFYLKMKLEPNEEVMKILKFKNKRRKRANNQ
ncbi:hypothetical protein PHOSAC3_1100002 [Mesotoga infera]|nr:hypothetical protein PHOSAC3_1100002 [Mesotoga infera]